MQGGGMEFGGPWGAGALTLLLPLGLVGACAGGGAAGWGEGLPSPPALLLVLAWVLAHALGEGLGDPQLPADPAPPAPPARPRPLRALAGLLVLGVGVGAALVSGPPLPPLGPLLPQLAAAASLVAFGLGLLLLARHRRGGSGGHPVYDFFVGPEPGPPLEPPPPLRWERPGLCAWGLVLVAAVGEQLRFGGTPPLPLVLVAAAQGLCLIRRLQALSQAPPPRSAGGFLGLFGGLAWLPFGGPLPAVLLLRRPPASGWGPPAAAACGLLYALGYWISSSAATQRALFARDPQDPRVAGFPRVPTARGRLLLAGGWWGVVRRPDHLGDLLMALGWSLPCGLAPPLLLTLLGAGLREHRALMAERRSLRELGWGWAGLCARVPHRLLPHIY